MEKKRNVGGEDGVKSAGLATGSAYFLGSSANPLSVDLVELEISLISKSLQFEAEGGNWTFGLKCLV